MNARYFQMIERIHFHCEFHFKYKTKEEHFRCVLCTIFRQYYFLYCHFVHISQLIHVEFNCFKHKRIRILNDSNSLSSNFKLCFIQINQFIIFLFQKKKICHWSRLYESALSEYFKFIFEHLLNCFPVGK